MINHLTEGFLLGIATGTTCLATCGPVYAPYLMQYERNLWKSIVALFEISIGRFITYAIFGVIAGFLGASIAEVNRDLFTASAYVLFSCFLLITTFRTNKKEKCCQTGKWAAFIDRPVILGILTGINFCPSFLLAITKAVDLNGPLAGFLLFTSFFVGTSLFLVPLSFFGLFGLKKQFRMIARISAILISVWFITQAGITFYHYILEKKAISEIDPKLIVNILEPAMPAYIIGTDTAETICLQKMLSSARKTDVKFINYKTTSVPESGIFFVGQELVAGTHVESNFLRKIGRFIIVLPDSSNKKLDSLKVNKLIDFLSFYSFKIDPDSGTIYQIPPKSIQ